MDNGNITDYEFYSDSLSLMRVYVMAMFKILFKTGFKENLKKEDCLSQTRLDLIHFANF